jgi:hypothetical protein
MLKLLHQSYVYCRSFVLLVNGGLMSKDQANLFIVALKNGEALNLSLYKDPKFCQDLQRYALKKVQSLLIELSEIHLHFEGSHERFYLSSFINRTDKDGFNMLDYCVIAGLDQFPLLFAVLGCDLHENIKNMHKSLQEYYDIEDAPKIITKINKVAQEIEQGIKQNHQTPLIKDIKLKPLQRYIKKFCGYLKSHKIAIFLISVGVCCLIATPFTFGASSAVGTVILFSVGVPALYAGLSNFQNATTAKKNYEQAENNSRTTEEGRILRLALTAVNEHIMELELGHSICHENVKLHVAIQPIGKPPLLKFRSKSTGYDDGSVPSVVRLTRHSSI